MFCLQEVALLFRAIHMWRGWCINSCILLGVVWHGQQCFACIFLSYHSGVLVSVLVCGFECIASERYKCHIKSMLMVKGYIFKLWPQPFQNWRSLLEKKQNISKKFNQVQVTEIKLWMTFVLHNNYSFAMTITSTAIIIHVNIFIYMY